MDYYMADNFHIVSEGIILSPAHTLEEAIGSAKLCAQALGLTVWIEKHEGSFTGVIGRCTADGVFEELTSPNESRADN